MVTKDFNNLLEEVYVELEKAPENIFQEKKEEYFTNNHVAYISYLIAERSFIEQELIKEDGLILLAENTILNVLLTVNPLYYNEVATGLEILKYELSNFPIFSIVANDPTEFIEEIDFYLTEVLSDSKKNYEYLVKQLEKHVEEQNKEFDSLVKENEEEGVV